MRRVTRIPLHRQPPVWLIACVVLASLSPVMLRAFGVELGPSLPGEPVAIARAGEPEAARPIVDLAARSPVIAGVDRPARTPAQASEPEILIFDDAPAKADAAATDVDAAHDDAHADRFAVAPASDAITEPTPRGAARPDTRASELSEAKAACRRGNKDAARSVYRGLPVGDSRRKEIRRACRQEGVWIL